MCPVPCQNLRSGFRGTQEWPGTVRIVVADRLALLRWLIQGSVNLCRDGNSDAGCERVEGDPEPVVGWFVGGDFVVAAAQVLNERVPGGQGLS